VSLKVYVGGKYGDEPTVVARSVEQAMTETLRMYIVLNPEETGYPQQWTCFFLDGDPTLLRCTVTLVDEQGESHALYVERYDLEDDADRHP
jgi:hypothetical protein